MSKQRQPGCLAQIKAGQDKGETLGDKTLTYSTAYTATDVHQLVLFSKNESFTQMKLSWWLQSFW